jgi:hypothetical protein
MEDREPAMVANPGRPEKKGSDNASGLEDPAAGD